MYTNTLQNKTLFQNGLIDGSGTFFVSEDVRGTQSSVEVMTDNGILIYASMDNSLYCWNSHDPFINQNLNAIYKVNNAVKSIKSFGIIVMIVII